MEFKFSSSAQQKRVEATVKKVCGYGTCYCAFSCGHANKADAPVPLTGKSAACPLAEFNVQPDGRSFFERSREENTLTVDELWEVCSACPHAEVNQSGVSLKDFYTVCLDCPIQATRENVSESIAEGACS